jgi:hypothetical protein
MNALNRYISFILNSEYLQFFNNELLSPTQKLIGLFCPLDYSLRQSKRSSKVALTFQVSVTVIVYCYIPSLPKGKYPVLIITSKGILCERATLQLCFKGD